MQSFACYRDEILSFYEGEICKLEDSKFNMQLSLNLNTKRSTNLNNHTRLRYLCTVKFMGNVTTMIRGNTGENKEILKPKQNNHYIVKYYKTPTHPHILCRHLKYHL